jgi:IS5 family transposase
MKQQTLAMAADQGFERHRKPTRRDAFLETMNRVVPWDALCAVVEPYYPKKGNGRPLKFTPTGGKVEIRLY